MVLDVRAGAVVAVRTTVVRYPCATFGDVGPLVLRLTGRARIGGDGRFAFRAGEPAERVTVTGVRRTRTHTITGTLRVRGSIATGQRCASAVVRFTARHG
jgi:hypothetical protein